MSRSVLAGRAPEDQRAAGLVDDVLNVIEGEWDNGVGLGPGLSSGPAGEAPFKHLSLVESRVVEALVDEDNGPERWAGGELVDDGHATHLSVGQQIHALTPNEVKSPVRPIPSRVLTRGN
jgi:hypothetical protein